MKLIRVRTPSRIEVDLMQVSQLWDSVCEGTGVSNKQHADCDGKWTTSTNIFHLIGTKHYLVKISKELKN